MPASEKYKELVALLQQLGKVVVAFSGGVDSTFLLKAAYETLGDKVKALTILSPYIPRWEIKEAQELVGAIGAKHEILEVPLLDTIRFNPENRCYLCKKAVFNLIQAKGREEGFAYVVDGTNFDDTGDYRPGLQALKELGIRSPLLETRLTKAEIRQLSRDMGLPTWDKPAYACLLTRIPYGSELKTGDFARIEQAETYLMRIGFRAVRVRCHGEIARIEVPREDRGKLFDMPLLDRIAGQLKAYGFRYVSLDLEGYRMGSLNEQLGSAVPAGSSNGKEAAR